MDAIVLCGGKGTRVSQITNDAIPKILIPIKGVPFIDYMIDALLMSGIRHIYFAAGFHGDQIKDYVETKLSYAQRKYGEYEVVIEDKPLDTGGALKRVMGFYWSSSNTHILVANGDTVVYGPKVPWIMYEMGKWKFKREIQPDWRTLSIAYARLTMSDGSLGMFNKDLKGCPPYCPIKNEGGGNAYYRINTFHEKVEGHGFTNLGWYILSANLFTDILDPDSEMWWRGKFSLEQDLLPRWVTENEFYYLDFHGEPSRVIDIGTTERIEALNRED